MIFFKFFILGILTSLLYPPFFMLPLGFIIFTYLINLISYINEKKSFINLFFSGSTFGFGFLIIYLSWIYNPFLVYESTKPFALLAILFPILLSLFFGLGFILFRYFKNKLMLILITPIIFIFIEFLISNFLYGFPWVSNSLILSNSFFGLYLLKFFGTLTSGYLIISIFLIASLLIYQSKNWHLKRLIFFVHFPFICFLIILFIFNLNKRNNNVSVKEVSIDAYQLLSPIAKKNNKEIKNNIISIIKNSNSDLIIFAENNYPYIIDTIDLSNLTSLIKKDKNVIIGATTTKNEKYFNSFILLEDKNIHFFEKQILVPFGEFLPFRKYLNFFEVISGNVDFHTGNKERFILTKDKLSLFPIICYEVIFDNIFNGIDKNKIDIIINITNDSWFGNKIGPYQHFYISRVKSLISNKPFIRVSNNGISAIIDNNGKILKYSKLNKKTNIKYNLKVRSKNSYIYFHKVFHYYLIILFIIFFIISIRSDNEGRL